MGTGGQTDRNYETNTRFQLEKNAFRHTDHTNYLRKDFTFIVHNFYSFRPYFLAIFREFQLWSTCTAFMANCVQPVVVVIVVVIFVVVVVVAFMNKSFAVVVFLNKNMLYSFVNKMTAVENIY
jgi:hypothetical protein